MCGIAGEISFNPILDCSWIKKGIEIIKHRGPDSHGFWSSEDKRVVFGHRRLSVIDLSDNGKQPMHSTCGNYSTTFNGEIYNYKNLTKELKNNGLSFKTKSDTEVILNSYKFWGDDFLNKIEGMFAFAIFDKKKNLVILARDKSGEKPLYFFKSNYSLSFCSELKGLFCDLRIKRKLSKKIL